MRSKLLSTAQPMADADADDADLYSEFKPDDASLAALDDGDGDGDGSDDRCVCVERCGVLCAVCAVCVRVLAASREAVHGGVHTGRHRDWIRSMCVRVRSRARVVGASNRIMVRIQCTTVCTARPLALALYPNTLPLG